MKEAGLMVGGFYKHFDSRDDLVAEAFGSALGGVETPAGYRCLGRASSYVRVTSRQLFEHVRIAIIRARAARLALWQEISHAAVSKLVRSSPGKFERTLSWSQL